MEDEREEQVADICSKSKSTAAESFLIQEGVDLKSFKSCLRWVCVDQSSIWKAGLSWSVFFVMTIFVPLMSHFVFQCNNCDETHRRPFDAIVQISLSVFATISFLFLSSWSQKYGLRKFLFLDKLCDVSEKVRYGYVQEIQSSTKILCIFVLPIFAAESVYKIWWYASGASQIPYFGSTLLSDTIACALQLCSWLYRLSIFILVCVLYRLICQLQILRIQDFAQIFQKETEVSPILREHLSIRKNLRVISHRFRGFILSTLLLVTASNFMSLLVTIKSKAEVNISKAGEITLCSISLVTGLFICLRSATKITHRAQALTGLAAKWHISATINSFDITDGETPMAQGNSPQIFPVNGDWGSDYDDEVDIDDDLDDTRIVPIFASTISFQKRQALVVYLENNRAGITVYGFVLDRTWIHAIFGVELALLLWLLNKTIGIS